MVQPLFITVDPERDTPERMAEFVGAFDPRITGLTGTLDQIKASTKSFKVYYAKAVQKEAPDGYTMEHTTSLYLIDPKGRFVRPYSYNATVNENADDLPPSVETRASVGAKSKAIITARNILS